VLECTPHQSIQNIHNNQVLELKKFIEPVFYSQFEQSLSISMNKRWSDRALYVPHHDSLNWDGPATRYVDSLDHDG
jgi:hypothetical protein